MASLELESHHCSRLTFDGCGYQRLSFVGQVVFRLNFWTRQKSIIVSIIERALSAQPPSHFLLPIRHTHTEGASINDDHILFSSLPPCLQLGLICSSKSKQPSLQHLLFYLASSQCAHGVHLWMVPNATWQCYSRPQGRERLICEYRVWAMPRPKMDWDGGAYSTIPVPLANELAAPANAVWQICTNWHIWLNRRFVLSSVFLQPFMWYVS